MGAGDKTGGTNMGKYLVKRILQMIPVMIIITMIIFILLNVAGDPTVNLLPLDATEAEREALRTAMGLNRPLPVQYLDFLKKAFTGDFGNSYRFNQPALQLAMARMPMSIQLAGAALLFAVVMAIPLGILSAQFAIRPLTLSSAGFPCWGVQCPAFGWVLC